MFVRYFYGTRMVRLRVPAPGAWTDEEVGDEGQRAGVLRIESFLMFLRLLGAPFIRNLY